MSPNLAIVVSNFLPSSSGVSPSPLTSPSPPPSPLLFRYISPTSPLPPLFAIASTSTLLLETNFAPFACYAITLHCALLLCHLSSPPSCIGNYCWHHVPLMTTTPSFAQISAIAPFVCIPLAIRSPPPATSAHTLHALCLPNAGPLYALDVCASHSSVVVAIHVQGLYRAHILHNVPFTSHIKLPVKTPRLLHG